MRGRTDHHRAVAQSGDRHDEGIALLDCANPGWRAGIDQVAGFKPVEAGYISYRFGNAPNQLGQVGVLPNFAIDRQGNPTGGEMAGLRRRVQEAERSRLLDIFARIPRPPLVASPELQVAARHVETGRIAIDVVERRLRFDGPAHLYPKLGGMGRAWSV